MDIGNSWWTFPEEKQKCSWCIQCWKVGNCNQNDLCHAFSWCTGLHVGNGQKLSLFQKALHVLGLIKTDQLPPTNKILFSSHLSPWTKFYVVQWQGCWKWNFTICFLRDKRCAEWCQIWKYSFRKTPSSGGSMPRFWICWWTIFQQGHLWTGACLACNETTNKRWKGQSWIPSTHQILQFKNSTLEGKSPILWHGSKKTRIFFQKNAFHEQLWIHEVCLWDRCGMSHWWPELCFASWGCWFVCHLLWEAFVNQWTTENVNWSCHANVPWRKDDD